LEYQTEDFQQQHQIAHIFGELVYDNQGLGGISVCDAQFSYGCVHAFFGQAISEHGLAVVSELGQVCEDFFGSAEASLGCSHGIGHGIGEYLGPEKLQPQLDLCDQLGWEKPYLGCSGGVFMEYNFPTRTDGLFTSAIRTFNSGDPTYPCNQISNKHKPSCYLEIAHYWDSVRPKEYQQMVEWCDQAESSFLREDCVRGVGKMMLFRNDFDIEHSVSLCQSLETQNQQTLCLAGLSWSVFSQPELQEKAVSICEAVPLSELDFCHSKADLLGIMFADPGN
jgi:hypothetical protein